MGTKELQPREVLCIIAILMVCSFSGGYLGSRMEGWIDRPQSPPANAALAAAQPPAPPAGTQPAQSSQALGPSSQPSDIRWTCITLHHTATPASDPARRMAAIHQYHTSLGWDGIGYHWLIGEDGSVWPGRPMTKQGAHVKGQNVGNIGIAFIGTYATQPPPPAALRACRRLLEGLMAKYNIPRGLVRFHRELAATVCPGDWDRGLLWKGD